MFSCVMSGDSHNRTKHGSGRALMPSVRVRVCDLETCLSWSLCLQGNLYWLLMVTLHPVPAPRVAWDSERHLQQRRSLSCGRAAARGTHRGPQSARPPTPPGSCSSPWRVTQRDTFFVVVVFHLTSVFLYNASLALGLYFSD